MNIFVAKLSPSTTSESLEELFEAFGEVKSANVIIDRDTGRSKRFGFVEMDNDDEAQRAIEALHESEFEDSEIVVQKAKPRESNRGGGGGYRGGGGRDNRGGGGYNRY